MFLHTYMWKLVRIVFEVNVNLVILFTEVEKSIYVKEIKTNINNQVCIPIHRRCNHVQR